MTIDAIPVSSIMTKNVKTANENQSIKTAAEIMDRNNIGAVIIVEEDGGGIPSGIITERDIVKLVSSSQISFNVHLSTVMKKPMITADSMMSLKDALHTMQDKNIRRLPVMHNGKMVGILTDKDIFRAILKSPALLSNFIDASLPADYRPVYQRFSEFMLADLQHPQSSNR
ncbi:putative signal-transduction protein containing cAMP-binding and CBS domains [Candidatus Nitrososphaera evergladensis SR1]|uniref:Putative signal-transduction protein containing cAMP-binding and CBS domains n=1 Tax=Candidatus Nitrososphaera evergladensis SR1 TaxID=1459636 RepID=A0A075MW46_9ARCH|nr:CBS domain-containing protein [Candidatus Nitrososphaera evergladensis]AIF85475.1 putative signal-transduction protein containing cAMP-binding and CBS domains [Candidatus Nitrososphaera evergladensis SR1]